MNPFKTLWDRAFGPKLRCKPGDLCLVIKQEPVPLHTGETVHVPLLGTPVKVVRHDGDVWILEEVIHTRHIVSHGRVCLHLRISGLADELLQPLRGDLSDDDAEEDAGRPVDAPAREEVTA